MKSYANYVNLELEFVREYNDKNVEKLYDYWKYNKNNKNKKFFTYKPGFVFLLYNKDTHFELKYPGYLTKFNSKHDKVTIKDFRVDMIRKKERLILSHTNIIVDLYSKSLDILKSYNINKENNIKLSDLQDYLIDIAKNAEQFELSKIDSLNKIEYTHPDRDIIDTVSRIHNEKGKKFNKKVNYKKFDYEELSAAIILISMQEDINHRISRRKQGRKMPFYRYLETIFCAYVDFNGLDSNHNLEEVIDRSLLKNKLPPKPWEDVNIIDYDSINNLKDWTEKVKDKKYDSDLLSEFPD